MLEKISMAEKRIRSAKPPTISAGVMTAKVIWKIANKVVGISPDTLSMVIEAKKMLPVFDRISNRPMQASSDMLP